MPDTALLAPPPAARPSGIRVIHRPTCRVTVHWYDLGYDVRCIRPDGHDGPHRDGVRWFDDHGLQVPRCPEPEASFVGMRAGSRRSS